MGKPEDIPQDTIDAVVGLERKYGDGHHSFELRDGIFALILAAKAEEREACARLVDFFPIRGRTEELVRHAVMECKAISTAIRKRGEG